MPRLLRCFLAASLALLLPATPALAQRVVYVKQDAAGAGDGTSWHDAYRELRTALPNAVAGDEVWVARATYKPTPGTDREATFQLRSGVAVYGGFVGTETQRDERDWVLNPTVLSGEIGSPTQTSDNSCHVVTATDVDSTAVLDGFIVTRGRSAGCAWGAGGGVLVDAADPTISNCEVTDNQPTGIYSKPHSSPTLRDCLIDQNGSIRGGGMFNRSSSPRLERVVFRGNTASDGGAIANLDGSHPVCVHCTFEGNAATLDGGAVHNVLSSPLFIRARFLENTAGYGGALTAFTESDLVCIGCTFERNESFAGGAVSVREADPVFVNTAFLGNRALNTVGGAIAADGGALVRLYNVVLAGNRSGEEGGALYATFARFEAAGLTASGNRAGAQGQHAGAVLYAVNAAPSVVANAVIWGNTGESVLEGAVDVRHAVVEGGCASPFVCEAVIEEDPLFVRAVFTDGAEDWGDLRLREGSPALDAGSAGHLPPDTHDLDGDGDTEEPLPVDLLWEPRVQGDSVDLGAYEGPVAVGTEEGEPIAGTLSVEAYPNPASGPVTVRFTLGRPGRVRLAVYDVLGRRVALLVDEERPSGEHRERMNLGGLPVGVYVVRVEAGSVRLSRRIVLAR